VTETNKNIQIVKQYHPPDYYRFLKEYYYRIYHTIANRYLSHNWDAYIEKSDSLQRNGIFYFHLHLSHCYFHGFPEIGKRLLEIAQEAANTPFQQQVVSLTRKFIQIQENGEPGAMDSRELHLTDYSPFMNTIFRTYAIYLKGLCKFPVEGNEMEECRKGIFQYSINDDYRNHLLSYLGYAHLSQQRWKKAVINFNYVVNKGFSLEENDPYLLLNMAYAILCEKSQRTECNWILGTLRKQYPVVIPAHENTQFLTSALNAK
ncbi:MAG: hypothetical protein D6813_13020, partial [Calditrichaeota bacterium]